MTQWKLEALHDLGFAWAKRKGQPSWDARFQELVEYHSLHGNCMVPTKYATNPALGRWVSTQRSQYKSYIDKLPTQMTKLRYEKLMTLGFKWNAMEKEDSDDATVFV
jgi:hypothetical protein